jgi:hypothetical protein
MKQNIGTRALSVLLAVMLVSVVMVPAMACEPGTPCSDVKQKVGQTDLSGLEKYEAVAFALNLNDVRKLSDIPRSEDLSMIVDNAKAFSLEKKAEDGSVNQITAVVLPVESVIENKGSVQTSNVVAVWDSNKSRVLKYTSTYQNKSLYKLTFSRIDSNGDVLEEVIVDGGVLVEGMPEQFFTAEDDGYWDCVAACIIGDCLCAILGIPCPGLPICDVCVTLLTPCYYMPSPYTCAPAAICMGLELAWCMGSCL